MNLVFVLPDDRTTIAGGWVWSDSVWESDGRLLKTAYNGHQGTPEQRARQAQSQPLIPVPGVSALQFQSGKGTRGWRVVVQREWTSESSRVGAVSASLSVRVADSSASVAGAGGAGSVRPNTTRATSTTTPTATATATTNTNTNTNNNTNPHHCIRLSAR
ncbi:hypothetical protein KCU88_g61, partial [Aureobasidium melanogenum]